MLSFPTEKKKNSKKKKKKKKKKKNFLPKSVLMPSQEYTLIIVIVSIAWRDQNRTRHGSSLVGLMLGLSISNSTDIWLTK